MAQSESSHDADRLIDHLFRHQAGRLIAILTRIFGPENLALAEDVAQEALVRALEVWPYHGVPENPTAWLAQVAKNQAYNVLKRDQRFAQKAEQLLAALNTNPEVTEPTRSEDAVDDAVRLMFVACHPDLSAESRVALTLKTVGGLSVEQIAGALLAQPTAVAQRLVRSKKQIRDLQLTFDVPAQEFPRRLSSVLEVIYLLFNEGYSASSGDNLVRQELCDEAIRLCRLVSRHGSDLQPLIHALLALMLLQSARLPARTNSHGELVLLEKQDRSLWNSGHIADGLWHLDQSAQGQEVSSYHLEAGIAACHVVAASYAETDWQHILELYDQLLTVNPSPVVALNRAVAVAQCHGPEAGIHALNLAAKSAMLQRYYLYWATFAKLKTDLADWASASACYRKALECPCSEPERCFLEESLAALTVSGARS